MSMSIVYSASSVSKHDDNIYYVINNDRFELNVLKNRIKSFYVGFVCLEVSLIKNNSWEYYSTLT